MSEKPEALRLADDLEVLHGAKKHHYFQGAGGQILGCESYRLVASGNAFAALSDSAKELRHLQADNERLRGLLRETITPVFISADLHDRITQALQKGDKT